MKLLALSTAALLLLCSAAYGQINEIIDGSGDGSGNGLDGAQAVALGPTGNVYVVGAFSVNVFEITPAGQITEIIDATGDGVVPLSMPRDVAVQDRPSTCPWRSRSTISSTSTSPAAPTISFCGCRPGATWR